MNYLLNVIYESEQRKFFLNIVCNKKKKCLLFTRDDGKNEKSTGPPLATVVLRITAPRRAAGRIRRPHTHTHPTRPNDSSAAGPFGRKWIHPVGDKTKKLKKKTKIKNIKQNSESKILSRLSSDRDNERRKNRNRTSVETGSESHYFIIVLYLSRLKNVNAVVTQSIIRVGRIKLWFKN